MDNRFWISVLSLIGCGILLANGTHFEVDNCYATPHSLRASQNTLHSAHCFYPCLKFNIDLQVWGTQDYTYDSPLCRAALHDNRISFSNKTQRNVNFYFTNYDLGRYYGSIQNGIRTTDYERLNVGTSGYFYFTSPRIEEPLLDSSSVSRGFLRKSDDDHVTQECHLGIKARHPGVKFQYYFIYAVVGRPIPKEPEGNTTKTDTQLTSRTTWGAEPTGNFYPGGLWCQVNDNSYSHVLSLAMDLKAHFYPEHWTVRASIGENTFLRMHRTGQYSSITWWKDAEKFKKFNGRVELSNNGETFDLIFTKVVPGNRGIYSLHGSDFSLRGITRLIIRGCTADKYGPSCEFLCPLCQNGGVCHDVMGGCICPPGFNGSLCENPCRDNHYGRDCNLLCSDSNPQQESTCKGLLFCLPDPFGCSCGAGFKGLDCNSPCSPGEFGSDCDQRRDCHCGKEDLSCEGDTGFCPTGDCFPGWKGTSCNISYPFLSDPPKLLGTGPHYQMIKIFPWDGTHGEGHSVAYGIELKRNKTGETFQEVLRVNYTSEPKELSLKNLLPNTRYEVRAVLLEEDGQAQRDSAPIAQFRTSCGAPEGTPEVTVDFNASKIVRLSWKLPQSSKWNCDTVIVRIQYNKSENSFNTTTDGSNVTKTVEFQTFPYTIFRFRLRLETPNGEVGNWTQDFEGRTAQDAPDKVENLTLSYEPKNRRVIAKWDKPGRLNGILKYYVVELLQLRWLYCNKTLHNQKVIQNVTEEYIEFDDLHYYSDYRVHVQGFTVKLGEIQYSDVRTVEDAPSGPPQNLSSYNGRSQQFSFKWSTPSCHQANGLITSYKYIVLGLSPWVDMEMIVDYTFPNYVVITQLTPYTDYVFRVHACTKIGCGETYSAINFTTEATVPGAPENLTIYRATMSSLSLSWNDPFPPYGPVSGFRIAYKLKSERAETMKPPQLKSNFACDEEGQKAVYCWTLGDLMGDQAYQIRVFTYGLNDVGGNATVEAVTKESVPGPPHNLNVAERTTSSLRVLWTVPVKQNGNITGYQVNLTQVNEEGEHGYNLTRTLLTNELNVTELKPATFYNISVAASTVKGYGPSIYKIFSTRSPALEIPDIPKVGNIRDETVEIFIKYIDLNHFPESAYFILVKRAIDHERMKRCAEGDLHTGSRPKRCSGNDIEDNKLLLVNYTATRDEYAAGKLLPRDVPPKGYRFVVGDGMVRNGYYNAPLKNGQSYQFGLAVVSEYQGDPKFCFKYSDPITVRAPDRPALTSAGWLVGIIIVGLLAIIAILLLLYYKKPKLFPFVNKILNNKKGPRSILSESSASLEMIYADCETIQLVTSSKIAVSDLEDFVKKAEASGKIKQEFRNIAKSPSLPKEVARLPENKIKNRYGNMLPFDDSRVVLEKVDDDPFSDYINANYIDGYKFPRKYIATQGPKPLTVIDFWRMIWQENVCKIVMITNILEGGKVKCEKYWPDTTDRFGQLTIQLIDTNTCSNYVIRTFHVSQSEDMVRLVTQFHFTTWPDHSVPMYPMAMGGFLKRLRCHKTNSKAPTVVHCSAGVGRTGTFLLLDCMMDMALTEDAVDLPSQLRNLRQQRINQIENSDQYTFAYRALAEVLCGVETSILCSDFCKEFGNLKKVDPKTERMPIQDHFERLERVGQPLKLSDCKAAVQNFTKNRNQEIIPPDRSRPILPSSQPDAASNYINAVYVNGYKLQDAFLVTEYPLPETVDNFWRMIKTANTRAIVLLQDPDQVKYWPEVGETPVSNEGDLMIEATSVENQGSDLIIRTFTITGPGEKEELVVKQFHFQSWSANEELPSGTETILDLIEKVEHWQMQTKNRPITVQCLDGASSCGIFCASMFICDKIKAEQEVDVYLAVRSIRHNRPQFITNLSQYLFCHQLALHFLDSFETYANFQ